MSIGWWEKKVMESEGGIVASNKLCGLACWGRGKQSQWQTENEDLRCHLVRCRKPDTWSLRMTLDIFHDTQGNTEDSSSGAGGPTGWKCRYCVWSMLLNNILQQQAVLSWDLGHQLPLVWVTIMPSLECLNLDWISCCPYLLTSIFNRASQNDPF